MMDEKSAKDLEESITEFGLVDPIIVNKYKGRENIIVGGHQRYNIAKKMGFEELPCVYVDLPLKAEQELNLRLNKNNGSWDWDMLVNLDEELLLNVGFDKDDFNLLTPDKLDDNFDLPDNEKNNIEQITFTLTREQNIIIKKCLNLSKKDKDYKNFNNENSNGNAIFLICKQWEKLKK